MMKRKLHIGTKWTRNQKSNINYTHVYSTNLQKSAVFTQIFVLLESPYAYIMFQTLFYHII